MWWTVAKEAATNWSGHKDARQGAALAYYSVFSLGPIIVIAIAIAGLFFSHEAVTSQVTSTLKEMMGDTGAKAIEAMLAGASWQRSPASVSTARLHRTWSWTMKRISRNIRKKRSSRMPPASTRA